MWAPARRGRSLERMLQDVSVPLEPLTRSACPELADAIRAAGDRTFERWESMVDAALPSADPHTLALVRDSLSGIIRGIGDAPAAESVPTVESLLKTAEHGAGRSEQTLKLPEMLQEYALVRQALHEEAAEQLGRSLETIEATTLNARVDAASHSAVLALVDGQARQLRTATEAQSKYLSFLSHDLRGGLNGIFLMIEVLKRELAGRPELAETLEDLDMMRRSLIETIGTMDRFLYAERFRKGKVQTRPSRVNLVHLLHEVAAQFAYQAKDKKIDLHVDVHPPAEMVSDRELMTVIIQNLLSNAVKYTGEGKPVTVTAQRIGDSPAAFRIEVADHGPGIAPEQLPHLFQSYTRGETHGQSGAGLGLSIAAQAAKLIDATVRVGTTSPAGSTFVVEVRELRLADANA